MKRLILTFIWLAILSNITQAQNTNESHQKIRNAVETREYANAVTILGTLEQTDKKAFEINNYDYLLARMLEKSGRLPAAMAKYQTVVNRNSILKEYALWHLSQLARASGNLMLERTYLQELQPAAPESLLTKAVSARLARSYFEGGNYEAAIRLLSAQLSSPPAQSKNNSNIKPVDPEKTPQYRENLSLLAQAYLQSSRTGEANCSWTRSYQTIAPAKLPSCT